MTCQSRQDMSLDTVLLGDVATEAAAAQLIINNTTIEHHPGRTAIEITSVVLPDKKYYVDVHNRLCSCLHHQIYNYCAQDRDKLERAVVQTQRINQRLSPTTTKLSQVGSGKIETKLSDDTPFQMSERMCCMCALNSSKTMSLLNQSVSGWNQRRLIQLISITGD